MAPNDVIKLYDSLFQNQANWRNLWQEFADWCMPTHDNINRVRTSGEEKPPQRLVDTAIEANYNFAAGFYSQMFPSDTMWAVLKSQSPEIMRDAEAARYYEEASRVVKSVMENSNFPQEEFVALQAIGGFGTNCMMVEEDDSHVVRFRNHMVGQGIVMDVNHNGEVDTVGRSFKLNCKQIVQHFGYEALETAGVGETVKSHQLDDKKKFEVIHMVCPRVQYDAKMKDKFNKPFASYYVLREGAAMLREGGFGLNPYKVGRFTVGNDDVYGSGPMSMCLGTVRRENVIYASVIRAAEEVGMPKWLVPDDDSVKFSRYLVKYRATSPNGKPERVPPVGDPGISMDMYKLHSETIKRAFFNHLFNPLEDYRNMTKAEVMERMSIYRQSLSAFTNRYLNEHVKPLLHHVLSICSKRGLLPEAPQIIVDNPKYDFDFVGPLSLATKSYEVMGAVDTVNTFLTLAQTDQRFLEVIDNVDKDKLFTDFWYSRSASMNSLVPEQERDEMRMQRAEAMQQQQQIENLAPVADAAQKMSGAVDPSSIVANLAKG